MRYKTCHRFGENFFSSIALSICREHSSVLFFVERLKEGNTKECPKFKKHALEKIDM